MTSYVTPYSLKDRPALIEAASAVTEALCRGFKEQRWQAVRCSLLWAAIEVAASPSS